MMAPGWIGYGPWFILLYSLESQSLRLLQCGWCEQRRNLKSCRHIYSESSYVPVLYSVEREGGFMGKMSSCLFK